MSATLVQVSVPLVQNGAQERVLSAIRAGIDRVPAIVAETGLNETAVRNAIRRLVDAGDVRRKFLGGYEAVASERCLLAEVWR